MKRFYRKVFKSKKPSLPVVSIHGPGPATSTSTIITTTTDLNLNRLLPSIPAPSWDSNSDANHDARAQVIAEVNVGVQLRPY
jgi:hypothetical protein